MSPLNTYSQINVRVKFIEQRTFSDGSPQRFVVRVEHFNLANDLERRAMGQACGDWQLVPGNIVESECMRVVRRER